MAKEGIKKRIARWTRRLRDPDAVQSGAGAGSGAPPPAKLSKMESDLARLSRGWNQHLPQLLDAVSIARDEARSANGTHDRIDALREDMDRLSERVDLNLADLKHRSEATQSATGIRVMNAVRFAEAIASGAKLHFLAADAPKVGFANVATRDAPGVDIVAPAGATLPFGECLLRQIVVSPGYPLDTESAAERIAGWWALLEPGGQLQIDRIDLAKALESVARGEIDPVTLAARISASEGAFAHGQADLETLRDMARSTGFTGLRVSKGTAGQASLRGVRPKRATEA